MYADSALSLVVPLSVIALVFITKRVVLSLFCGVVIAGVMMAQGWQDVAPYVWKHISNVFYGIDSSGEIVLATNGLYVFGFLLILGILSQLIAHSGGVGAFVAWARQRVKSPRGSELVAFIAGIVIFIDDYFNALSVGQISRSLNDANGSTRERLAYIIDSTSAPICILMPISKLGCVYHRYPRIQTSCTGFWSVLYLAFQRMAQLLCVVCATHGVSKYLLAGVF